MLMLTLRMHDFLHVQLPRAGGLTRASPCDRSLAAGAALKLWSARGTDDGEHLYWGRRQVVWANEGDVARLLDPDAVERARATYLPLPTPPKRRPRRR